MQSTQTIPSSVLAQPIHGLNLTGETLQQQLTHGPTLMVFLRHFGCIFCREMVADIRRLAEAKPDYPHVLFFFMASTEDGEKLFGRLWPEARAIADPDKVFYNAFDIERGGLQEMFGIDSWVCGVRAVTKGHVIGATKGGDPWTLPTLLLVEGGKYITWEHRGVNASDHPDFTRIPALVSQTA